MAAQSSRRAGRVVFATGPLSGASVVVTRPAATARELRRRGRALGATIVNLPGVVLRRDSSPAATAGLRAAQNADVAIFVSPAAVRFAFALRRSLRFARHTVVCAIGRATQRALLRRGVRQVAAPAEDRQDSDGLLALAPLRGVRGKRVAIVGAPGGREQLAPMLRLRRAKVEEIHVYARRPPRFSSRQLAELEHAAAPLLTLVSSAEVLDNLREHLPLSLYARLAAGDLIVSSARLAELARSGLFARIHVAASPAPADLLHTAAAVLTRHRL
jgi:uroporphyrinogen-III synthase